MKLQDAAFGVLMGALVCAPVVAVLVARHAGTAKPSCAAKKAEAAISARAAEICTGEFIGCSLNYAEVRKLVAEAQAAKACD